MSVLLTGYVKNQSGQPIPFATVFLADEFFDDIPGQSTVANAAGYFSFYANPDGVYYIGASSVGYTTRIWMIEKFQSGSALTLKQNVVTLDPVIVTSTTQKPFPIWLLAIPAAILLLDDKKKGRSISGIKEIYTGLPKWARGVVIVGGSYVAFTTISRLLRSAKEKQEPTDAGNTVDDLGNQGVHPTYTDAQFESFSNAIVAAIWDCGTDEDAIYNVMNAMRNEADIYQLIKIYGVRRYKGCFENFFGLIERSLSGAISSELDNSEKARVNNILRSKGIQFQFA